MSQVTTGDRTELWLPLLQRLSQLCPYWVVWKNAESAFTGVGDIDAAAPDADWPTIELEFRHWAQEHKVGPVAVCHHIPGGMNLVAVPPGMATLLEVGVKATRIWRGTTLFVLDDLKPLMDWDPRGFRRLRPGAEGLFKLLLNGVRWDGKPNAEGLRSKQVIPLLQQDPGGVYEAARVLGPAQHLAIRAAERVVAGGWDRNAMLAVQFWALLKCARHPTLTINRVRFLMLNRMGLPFTQTLRCPVVAALDDKRRIPVNREQWLMRVAATHPVYA